MKKTSKPNEKFGTPLVFKPVKKKPPKKK